MTAKMCLGVRTPSRRALRWGGVCNPQQFSSATVSRMKGYRGAAVRPLRPAEFAPRDRN